MKQVIKDKYWLLVLIIFGIILLSRVLYLGADLPSTHIEIEEKAGGYNARNMVIFRRWPLYNNWYQPMVYMPVQNFLSYLSFKFFGIGLSQFRLPMIVTSFSGLIFLFLIFLKQTNRTFALVGLIVYTFGFEMTVWNRSGLCENLYLLFMPLSVYFLTKKDLKGKDIFFSVFFGALNVVVKADGYSFYLALIIFLFFWSLRIKSFKIYVKGIIFGTIAAFFVLLFLLIITDSFKYFLPMYHFYFNMFGKQASFFKGLFPTLQKLVSILLSIDPYIFVAFLASSPVLIVYRNRLNRTDWFMILFLSFAVITRLQVPFYFIYWKRVIFLFFPVLYVIFRALFFLLDQNSLVTEKAKTTKEFILCLIFSSVWSPLFLFVYLNYYGKSIYRIYRFGEFSESFHYTKGSFIYLLFIVIMIICSFNWILLLGAGNKPKKILASSILFLIFISLVINGLEVVRIYLPGNVRYSYQENQKYVKLIPENEMIVSDEQGFRAFAYLSKHDFYFNHDGGPNPVPYREILENKDLRYSILNIEEFRRSHWGISNNIRLEFIRQLYPDLKLIDIFFASKIPLAIYDKYGNR